MKRSFALISAGSITTIVAVFVLITVLSTMAAPTAADQQVVAPSPAPVSEPVQVAQPANVVPQEDFNTEFEAAAKERERLLQEQIAQLQQALTELDSSSQAQIAGMEQQTIDIQGQSDQVVSNIEALQNHAGALQQAIQADSNTFQVEMDKMTNAETQMRQQIEALNTQLASAYNQITQQQALAAAAAEAAQYNSGGGHGNNDHGDRHGDNHDDDHDDDHDDHDDDD